jgi:hypothetical protein
MVKRIQIQSGHAIAVGGALQIVFRGYDSHGIPQFKFLHGSVGCAGYADPDGLIGIPAGETFSVSVVERSPSAVTVVIDGPEGHPVLHLPPLIRV